MKKIFIIVLLFCSCKKETEQKTWFEVKDRITGTPVKGAAVSIYKCTPGDPLCGLIAWQSALTADDGRCGFSTADYNRVTFASVIKSDYWGISGSRNTSVSLYPEGWIRLQVTAGTAYPSQSSLIIHAFCADPNIYAAIEMSAPADSIVRFRCFGGQTNRVDWTLMDAGYHQLNSGTWNQQVPRLDTVAAMLSY